MLDVEVDLPEQGEAQMKVKKKWAIDRPGHRGRIRGCAVSSDDALIISKGVCADRKNRLSFSAKILCRSLLGFVLRSN